MILTVGLSHHWMTIDLVASNLAHSPPPLQNREQTQDRHFAFFGIWVQPLLAKWAYFTVMVKYNYEQLLNTFP